ncbi:MAG: SagB family peptide dehydrogenase [Pseudomonadota bacterium]
MIELPLVSDAIGVSLFEALAHRESVRAYADAPLTLVQLSLLLGLSAQNTAGPWTSRGDGIERVARLYPSAGGLHALELYLALDDGSVEGLAAGLHHYCPQQHACEWLCGRVDAIEILFERARSVLDSGRRPPVLVLITSRMARARSLYPATAYSMVLKEVGALLQTLYLAATALGLAPCALAALDDGSLLEDCAQLDARREPLLGELAIGLPRSGSPAR